MSNTKSLSSLWRENKSADPGTDLASVIDAARILAQSLVPEARVTFSGVNTATVGTGALIELTSSMVGDVFPTPGDKVDILLGLTVHEVGHIMFSPDKDSFVRELAHKLHLNSGNTKQFMSLIEIFEDVMVNAMMSVYPGYKEYLRRALEHNIGTFNPDSILLPLKTKCTRQDILNALVYIGLYGGKLPLETNPDNAAVIVSLTSLIARMITKKISRERAITEAWHILESVPVMLTKEERGFKLPAPKEPDSKSESQPNSDAVAPDADTPDGKADDTGEHGDEPIGDNTEDKKGDNPAPAPGDDTPIPESESSDKQGDGEETESGDGDGEETESEDEDGEEDGDGDGDEDLLGKSGDDAIETGEPEPGVIIDTIPEPDTSLDLSQNLAKMDDKTSLPSELANEVTKAIIERRSDLTQLVSALAKNSNYNIMVYTPEEDAIAITEARSHTTLAEEKLRRILQEYRLRRTADFRGLTSGRISTRRLSRVGYGDQRVFQRRERPEEIDMSVCLLEDLSGSVYQYRALLEQIVCAITDAFSKEKVEFMALGYSGNGRNVNIPRLYDKETGKVNLGLTKEWGSTPSYEGLAAAIAQLLRLTGNKRKVLIHFTDGQPNDYGQSIPELLSQARAKGIIDVHICLTASKNERFSFRALYGENTLAIDNINQLPEIIEKELRRRLV